MPDSEVPDLRDYLFVDRQRVGSLLAQFAEGLPANRTEERHRSRGLRLGLENFFSVERDLGQADTQTLALADLHVSQLEENAEALGILADVSEQIQKRKNWLRGKVRKQLKPGMLLRVSAPTQISDVSTILSAFRSVFGAFTDQKADEDFHRNQEIFEQIEVMYGNSTTISIRSAGEDDFDVAFVGEIPHDIGFGPMRRELLLSQVGARATDLTTLLQISAVPSERDTKKPVKEIMRDLMPQMDRLTENEQLNRRVLDQLMTALGGVLAESGAVAAPKWPAISIIPLAIYRQIEPVPDLTGE